MPVYSGVPANHLRRALQSVYEQSFSATEVIVVEDGALDVDQHTVLDEFTGAQPPLRRIVLPVNQGAGVANQQGLLAATGDWIAKMDADDICVPTRFEKQVELLRSGEVDVLGAAMTEFEMDEQNVTALRRSPITHDEIAARMRMNSPINHPTSIYRRELAIRVGGYPDMRYMQDYDLFARMLTGGARMANTTEPLVLFRADEGMYRRRGSSAMTHCEIRLQRNLRRYGVIGLPRMVTNLILRLIFRRLPRPLLRSAYRILFHSQKGAA